MTWLFVTMWPRSSHTKPEPVPCGMVKMLRENRSSTRAVVEMYTTEPFERSNSSMVAFSSAARSPRAAIGRGCAAASSRAGCPAQRGPCQARNPPTMTTVSKPRNHRLESMAQGLCLPAGRLALPGALRALAYAPGERQQQHAGQDRIEADQPHQRQRPGRREQEYEQ